MTENQGVVVRLDLRNIMTIVSIAFLVAIASTVLYIDSSTSYSWIIPLDKPKDVFLLSKPHVDISVYHAISRDYYTISHSGVGLLARVNTSGDYMIVKASGPSLYTLTIISITILAYIPIKRKIDEEPELINPRSYLIVSIFLLAVFMIPLLSLVLFIDSGIQTGYAIRENPVTIHFKNLTYGTIVVNNTQYFVYIISDSVDSGDTTLVSYRLNLEESTLPLVILEYSSDGMSTREITISRSLYIHRGWVNITVLAPSILENSYISYYKAEFTKLRDYSIESMLAPVISLVVSVMSGLIVGFMKKRITKS